MCRRSGFRLRTDLQLTGFASSGRNVEYGVPLAKLANEIGASEMQYRRASIESRKVVIGATGEFRGDLTNQTYTSASAMSDALEDILLWERISEHGKAVRRTFQIGAKQSV
jgi:hypothetical protein